MEFITLVIKTVQRTAKKSLYTQLCVCTHIKCLYVGTTQVKENTVKQQRHESSV